ncbi:Crp/Fnr family transcriptional regulator [Sphingomonas oryzagri]
MNQTYVIFFNRTCVHDCPGHGCYGDEIVGMFRAPPREVNLLPPSSWEKRMIPWPDPVDVIIAALRVHGVLEASDLRAICGLRTTLRAYDQAAYLVREGEEPEHCAILVSGFAFRQKLTSAGTRAIVSLHVPGDILDIANLYLDVADHNVQTLVRSVIVTVPRAQLRDVARAHPVIGQALFLSSLKEASILREWVVNVGRRDAKRALAHLLCEFARRMGHDGRDPSLVYEFPMTQEQIGDALGLTSVHVNRMMRSMQLDGLISQRGRMVRFSWSEDLRDLADFSARYLHLDQNLIAFSPA